LDFGEETQAKVKEAIDSSFKLFWDGCLTFFPDCQIASSANKNFVKELLDMRDRTANDVEPPVTLLHGEQTETVLTHCVRVIKREQEEFQEEQKRKAKEAARAAGEEEEETAGQQFEDSEDKMTTIEQDVEGAADFKVWDCPKFTLKILQGIPNKAIENLNVHPKKSPAEEEEDLALLDEI